MIRAVIFDCYGVLVGRGFKETYRQAGGDPIKDSAFIEELLGAANMGLITSQEMSQQIVNKLGISFDTWQGVVATSEQPHEELIDYIRGLKDKYKIAILSNANIGSLEGRFTPEQLAIFDEVVVSAEVGVMKPDPAIYKLTAEKLDVSPNECVFIDDSEGYCIAARQFGMQAIYYQHFDQLKQDLEKILEPIPE